MKVGILGGGQLSRMLALASYPLGLSPIVFAKNQDEPAAQVAPVESALTRFLASCDQILFESEFPPKELTSSPLFFPSLKVFEVLRSKLSQKILMEQLEIPAAPFIGYFGDRALEGWLLSVKERLGDSILKWAEGGYDGYGVLEWDSKGSVQNALEFCRRAIDRGYLVYAEKKIAFRQELALVGVRSQQEIVFYPLVKTEQRDGVCVLAWWDGIPHPFESKAQKIANTFCKAVDLHGTFAIEFFETKEGLLVNEVAPRVHNSGHFSLNASSTSQFENHLRAMLGAKLGSCESRPFAMANLLGTHEGLAKRPDLNLESDLFLHWYGKKESRKRRKMGHVNVIGEKALERAKRILVEWEQTC